jgi:hypothetical protein
MLKMKDDPTISMKTKGKATKCLAAKPTFLHENAPPSRDNRRRKAVDGGECLVASATGIIPVKGRMPGPTRKTRTDDPAQGGFHGGGGGERSRGERALKKKMLINDERSLNVYENKRKDDKFSNE